MTELAAALRNADLGCQDLARADIVNGGKGAQSSSGSCSVAGEGVQLIVFESEADADDWFERGRMEFTTTARGSNWVVVTSSQATADEIASALDGNS